MKIYLSKGFRKALKIVKYYLIFSFSWLILALLLLTFIIRDFSVIAVLFLPSAWGPGILIAYFWDKKFHYEYLFYTVVDKNIFTSFSGEDEKLYELDTDKPVYYVIFKPAVEFVRGEVIAFSNERFEFNRQYRMLNIKSFDVHKTVFLPYNNETRKILNRDKWERVIY